MWATLADRVGAQAPSGETNDCAVKALALVAGASYPNAHRALAEQGREPGSETYRHELRAALEGWGLTVRRTYTRALVALLTGHRNPTTGEAAEDPEPWAELGDRLLVFTEGHVAALVDGRLEDWTEDYAAPVVDVWEVVRQGAPLPEAPPVVYL